MNFFLASLIIFINFNVGQSGITPRLDKVQFHAIQRHINGVVVYTRLLIIKKDNEKKFNMYRKLLKGLLDLSQK